MSFSKYEIYTTVQSIYCYPDSDILINRLGIRDAERLKSAEEELTAVKQLILLREPISGRFSKTHLMKIHHFLFEDIYPFAGKIRKESISKGTTMFYPPSAIQPALEKLFSSMRKEDIVHETDFEQQVYILTHAMTELNIIHPFREGNGRAIREFIRCLGLHYGLSINWGNADKEQILDASIRSVDDENALSVIIQNCIEN